MMSRVLAVDFGRKRIGLAISDETGIAITNLQQLSFTDPSFWDDFSKVISENEPSTLVIGKPLTLEGGESELQQQIDDFSTHTKRLFTNLEVVYFDERFTSRIAESVWQEGRDLKGSRKKTSGKKRQQKSESFDSMAAHILLRSYLDSV